MPVLPMFPLGSVLFPGAALPLHVFEPRYRQLVRDCLAADGEFGVVLIERGSEVGGGDVRTDAGTVARIVEAAELPDGRWALIAVGARRVRVQRWLDDDPYPRADVADWPDPPPTSGLREAVAVAQARVRRALALAVELGEPAPPATVELDDADPVLVVNQLCALAPLGPFDRQRLLVAPTADARTELLVVAVDDVIELFEARLRSG